MIYIATQSLNGQRVKIGEIAEHIDSPEAFTAKVLGALVKNNLLVSVTGPYGGFYIDESAMKKISLAAIVSVIDGDAIYTGCGLGLKQCNALKPCPLHNKFAAIRTQLKQMLQNTNIYDLATGLVNGETILMRN